MSKYNKGDILFTISLNKMLMVTINKVIITNASNNYSYTCLSTDVNREHQLDGEDYPVSHTISGSVDGDSLVTKENLDAQILVKVQKMRDQLERQRVEAEKFTCPLTGGKMTVRENIYEVMDGSTYYDVEGSSIVWEKYSRDWTYGVFHTTWKGIGRHFSYHQGGNWEELILVNGANGRGKYFNKEGIDSGELSDEFDQFIEEELKRFQEEYERRMKLPKTSGFEKAVRVSAGTVSSDSVKAMPMSEPSDMLFYMETGDNTMVKINIIGQGEFEMRKEEVDKWGAVLENGVYTVGDTKFTIDGE